MRTSRRSDCPPAYPTLLEVVKGKGRVALAIGGGLVALSTQGCWGVAPNRSIDPPDDAVLLDSAEVVPDVPVTVELIPPGGGAPLEILP